MTGIEDPWWVRTVATEATRTNAAAVAEALTTTRWLGWGRWRS
jgi:hypothetical protein